jgi:hypothetical protein
MKFEPNRVEIRGNCCDHCGNYFTQNDYNNNRKGASGWMYWFCGNCLYLIQKMKREK